MSVVARTHGLEVGDHVRSPLGGRGHITSIRLEDGELMATVAEVEEQWTEHVDWPVTMLTPSDREGPRILTCRWHRCVEPALTSGYCLAHEIVRDDLRRDAQDEGEL